MTSSAREALCEVSRRKMNHRHHQTQWFGFRMEKYREISAQEADLFLKGWEQKLSDSPTLWFGGY